MCISNIKIINFNGITNIGTVKLQGAHDVKFLYENIKTYFEENLLSNSLQLSDAKWVQDILNKKARDIPVLNIYSFHNDVRVIELAVLIGLLETVSKLGWLNPKYIFYPAWQIPKEDQAIQSYTNKNGSWDGFLLGVSKTDSSGFFCLPLELKSLMIDPKGKIHSNPNNQLKTLTTKFQSKLKDYKSINSILVMPYTNENKLNIDIGEAIADLRSIMHDESIGCLCVLSFPHTEDGHLAMSILFAMVNKNPEFANANNYDKWMKYINFGKSKYRLKTHENCIK